MGVGARRRLAVLVPWVALVLVTALALWQLGSRRGGPSAAPAAPSTAAPVVPVVPAVGADDALRRAAHGTEEALADAIEDLDDARADLKTASTARTAAESRAETAEAALALASARVEALEAEAEAAVQEVGIREGGLDAARERLAELEAELEAARDPVGSWLADAVSEDPAARAAVREAVAKATPAQVERLRDALADDASLAGAVAALVGALPEGEARDDLAVRVLVAPDAGNRAVERVAAVGAEILSRPAVAAAVLVRAPDAVGAETLRWLAGRELDWGPEQRERLTETLLGAGDVREVAVRAVALLRLEGAAPRLLELRAHEDPRLRATVVYALSRVPDLDAVRAEVSGGLPALLDDPDAAVRTAATLLAAALLGEPVDFDPHAGEAERRAARDRILDRLP